MTGKRRDLSSTGGAPPTIDPWVVAQLGKCARQVWVNEKFSEVYSKDVVDLKLSSLEKSIYALEKDRDDTNRIMIEQRGKLSNAPKRHEVNDLKGVVGEWSSWFRRIVVGIIVFLIGTGGMVVWKYASLTMEVESYREELDEVVRNQSQMLQIQKSQKETIDFLKSIIRFQEHSSIWKSADKESP